ncbi:MAG: methyltransferase domain-containing protein [Ignavibacteria bacterium]|nr:methyltransferase domain-containing protein [Ignavibacteria bacterium]
MAVPDSPFSDIARGYDAGFSDLAQVRVLRERVQRLMLAHFPRGGSILEIGCGTGIDARFLAGSGRAVLATDPSRGMLAVARERCHGLENVDFVHMPAEHLACVRDRSMDGILSNFGALNCVERLQPVFNDAYHILRDNGVFIVCLLNRFSIAETVAYLQHGKVRQAFRRWRRGGVSVSVGTQSVLTWYHSLRAIKRMIRGKFIVQHVAGLNILTPPPSFEGLYRRHPKLIALAGAVERRIDTLPVVSTLGDHYVIVLERFE